MRCAVLLTVCLLPAAAACRAVEGDSILARDAAAETDLFRALDPQMRLGFAPLPGARRTYSGQELLAIARRAGLRADTAPAAICFERAVQPLNREALHDALLAALGVEGAELEVLDFTREPMPAGQLEFRAAGVADRAVDAATPLVWRGRLSYGAGRTLSVWAKVRVWVNRPVATASRDIPAGSAVLADMVSVATRDISPFTPHCETAAEVVERVTRRRIPAGAIIAPGALETPPDIRKGETVRVSVTSGGATITFDARAEGDGRAGGRITLTSPENRKLFRATVEKKGRAVVRI